MATRCEPAPGRRSIWPALLLAASGHAALIAALVAGANAQPSLSPPQVLAVSWVGDEPPAAAAPAAAAQPPPSPTRAPARVVARSEPPPLAAAPAASQASEASASVADSAHEPAAASAGAVARGDAAPLTAPRFDADYLSNPAPAYPPLSRRRGEQGRVLLRVLVSAQGTAHEVQLRSGSGFERLDAAAIDAVRQWRFVAARQGDEAVAAWVIVPISFTLRR